MNKFLITALSLYGDFYDMANGREKEIIAKWKLSAKLPRKKKKLVRKSLTLDWSINEHLKQLLKF